MMEDMEKLRLVGRLCNRHSSLSLSLETVRFLASDM